MIHPIRPEAALNNRPQSGQIAVVALRGCASSSVDICRTLQGAGLSGRCLGAMVALVGLVRAGGRTIDVASRHHPWLTQDELMFAAAISALQRGTPWQCQRLVAGWVAPTLVPRALGLLALIAEEFARAGLRLPSAPPVRALH